MIEFSFDGWFRPGTRVLKKKKLKINIHRPVGTRFVFDDEGNTLPPLAKLADTNAGSDSGKLNKDKGKFLCYFVEFEVLLFIEVSKVTNNFE